MQPDILLLDEPTNHIDLHAVAWLTDYVNSLDITCVIVSHDQRFLSDVTTDTIHFYQSQLKYYQGNFTQFLKSREEQGSNIQRQQEALDAKRAHIRESIEKMKSQAKKSGKGEMKLGGVASRQKKLGRIGFELTADGKKFNAQSHGRRIGCENNSGLTTSGTMAKRTAISTIEPPEPGFKFIFPQPSMDKIPEGVALLSLKDVAFGYGVDEGEMEVLRKNALAEADVVRASLAKGEVPEPPSATANEESPLLLAGVDFVLRAGDKIGVVGLNGLGKSTFLNLLSQKLQPCSGESTIYEGVRIGVFTQHFVDQLDLRLTPVQHLLNVAPHVAEGGNSEQSARAVLGRFGLAGKLALAPIGTLSGGQRARLVFACITSLQPQILILDEPSNHLDFVTLEALKDAIQSFQGAVLLVSHDQSLMSESCEELYVLEKRKVVKAPKVNPNQLKAAALKAQKEIAAQAKAAASKSKKPSSSSSSSSSSRPLDEKLKFPSRCQVRKLDMTFEEYRESMTDEM